YALGAILFEMLTGRPPFQEATALETQRKVVSDECPPPSRLSRGIPRDLEVICLTCLSKSARDRYESAGALADDLDRFIRLEPIRARPIGAMERTAKWTRRKPALAVALAACALLVLVSGAGILWSQSQKASVRRAVENDLAEARQLE